MTDVPGPVASALPGVAAGMVASWVKARSEPPLARVAERLLPPRPQQRAEVGADPTNPRNTPPAVLVDRITRSVAGRPSTDREKVLALEAVHYTFGTSLGVGYALAVRRWPPLAAGAGAPAGAALYLATHGTALPLLRIQPAPTRMPPYAVAWEAASHVVYGVVLELTRRLAVRLLPR
jgi:putative membrane protein